MGWEISLLKTGIRAYEGKQEDNKTTKAPRRRDGDGDGGGGGS